MLLHSLLGSVFPESLLTFFSDLVDPLHRSDRFDEQVSVVSHRSVSSLLEVEGGVYSHLLPHRAPVSLGPLNLPRISLQLEVLEAFRSAELEDLAIIPYEGHAVARVYVT